MALVEMKAAAPTLKERGIAKPTNKRQKVAAKHLNGSAKPIKVADVHLTAAQRRRVIGEWRELVNFIETVASPAFAHLTMTHLWMIHKKIEVPPAKGIPSDVAIDDFARSMAKMIYNLFVEIGAPSNEALWHKLLGGTLVECLGPRPEADRPSSIADTYPVDMQMQKREKPLQEKHVHELENEAEFEKWLAAKQAREGAAT